LNKNLEWSQFDSDFHQNNSKNEIICENDTNNSFNLLSPRLNGWCWEGIHCTNPFCKFKHRNLPPVDSNPNTSLPSSIRGPRQHKNSSNVFLKYDNNIIHNKLECNLDKTNNNTKIQN